MNAMFRLATMLVAVLPPPVVPQNANLAISWTSSLKNGSGGMVYLLEQDAIVAADGTVRTPAEFNYTWRKDGSRDYMILTSDGLLRLNTPTGTAAFNLTISAGGAWEFSVIPPLIGRTEWGNDLVVTITGFGP